MEDNWCAVCWLWSGCKIQVAPAVGAAECLPLALVCECYLHFLQDFIQGYPFMVSTMLAPGQMLGTLPGTSVIIQKKVTIALLS